MKAQFRSICVNDCGELIQPGDEIVGTADGWAHERCRAQPDTDPAAYGALCGRCFTYHRGECA